ncbi:josephin-2 isoform X2 [Mobula birostris]|uniref:josephin-2 isoform X2 n=1 Tax=Mobula birostris TaxID=1983395 RepID=UPI003B2885F2
MSEPPTTAPARPLYHERQRLELCAAHALNNLLQRRAFGKDELDRLCYRSLGSLDLSRVLGFILNIPSNVSLGPVTLPIRRQHWVAVRPVHGSYYNLDSKLKAPAAIGSEAELRKFLTDQIAQDSCELLLVVERAVEEDGSWLSPL